MIATTAAAAVTTAVTRRVNLKGQSLYLRGRGEFVGARAASRWHASQTVAPRSRPASITSSPVATASSRSTSTTADRHDGTSRCSGRVDRLRCGGECLSVLPDGQPRPPARSRPATPNLGRRECSACTARTPSTSTAGTDQVRRISFQGRFTASRSTSGRPALGRPRPTSPSNPVAAGLVPRRRATGRGAATRLGRRRRRLRDWLDQRSPAVATSSGLGGDPRNAAATSSTVPAKDKGTVPLGSAAVPVRRRVGRRDERDRGAGDEDGGGRVRGVAGQGLAEGVVEAVDGLARGRRRRRRGRRSPGCGGRRRRSRRRSAPGRSGACRSRRRRRSPRSGGSAPGRAWRARRRRRGSRRRRRSRRPGRRRRRARRRARPGSA